uniref:Uncharacterized protein n=1 Tax=Arundo donax TaxID=35708 RepID=A0A0A9B9Z9_ARUDO
MLVLSLVLTLKLNRNMTCSPHQKHQLRNLLLQTPHCTRLYISFV